MVYRLYEEQNKNVLLEQVEIADNFWLRFLGLMGRATLPEKEGLLLKKVGSVHTCFMRFSIQVIYLDKEYRVIAKEVLRPWRCGKLHRKAAHVLETGVMDGDNIRIDMILRLESCN